ncbi:MAG: hypothetical protein Kow0075_07020 [Salibacteraceae bacterium]
MTVNKTLNRAATAIGWMMLSVLCVTQVAAQTLWTGTLLDNKYPLFEPEAAEHYRVKKVEIKHLKKWSGQPIFDTRKRTIIWYDSAGNLSALQEVWPGSDGWPDTLTKTWTRNRSTIETETEHTGNYTKQKIFLRNKGTDTLECVIRVKRGNLDWDTLTTEFHFQSLSGGVKTTYVSGKDGIPYMRVEELSSDTLHITNTWVAQKMVSSLSYGKQSEGSWFSYEYKHMTGDETLSIMYLRTSEEVGTWCRNEDCLRWTQVLRDDGAPRGWIFFNEKNESMDIWEFSYDFHSDMASD